MDKAKVFWSGRSQAVRLPKKYRFDTDEVTIRREGDTIILTPTTGGWEWLDAISGPFDTVAVAAMEEPVEAQERPELAKLR